MSGPAPEFRRRLIEQQALRGRGDEHRYLLYEDITSPYSAKVRVYLHHKNIAYRSLRTTFQAYMGTIPTLVGMPIIPVMLAPDGRVMQDSTPILTWLETQHAEPATVPADARTALLHWILEDFADEYLPRFSMHYRWGNEISRETIAHRIARRFAYGDPEPDYDALAAAVLARQSGFDTHLGIDDSTRPDLDAQLRELLAVLDAHLAEHSFLFGERPSIADFAIYGHLYAHLFCDPFSMRLLERYAPHTCDWIESITDLGDDRGARGRTDFGAFMPWHVASRALLPVLGFVAQTWLPIGAATAVASTAREKRFDLDVRGFATKMSTSHYRAWAFEEVQHRVDALDAESRDAVREALALAGNWTALLDGPRLHNALFDGLTPPFVTDGAADNRIRHKLAKR